MQHSNLQAVSAYTPHSAIVFVIALLTPLLLSPINPPNTIEKQHINYNALLFQSALLYYDLLIA